MSSDDDYEDDRPDFNSQTQLHVAVAGAKVLNRKGNELRNLDDDYEDDRPDSQTQLHVTVAGAKVLNRKGKELQNLDPENKNTIISDTRVRKRPPDASSQTKQQEPKSTTQQVKLPANELRKLNPENKNTIISDKRVRKRPADASLTNQQGPKSTSQPGSTITVSQRLTGCRIQCDSAHPTPLSFSAQLPILVSDFNGIVYWGTQSIH